MTTLLELTTTVYNRAIEGIDKTSGDIERKLKNHDIMTKCEADKRAKSKRS